MSYYEGTNHQARKEDEGKPMFGANTSKNNSVPGRRFEDMYKKLLSEMQPKEIKKGWHVGGPEAVSGSIGFIKLKDGRIAEIQLHITCDDTDFINDEPEQI